MNQQLGSVSCNCKQDVMNPDVFRFSCRVYTYLAIKQPDPRFTSSKKPQRIKKINGSTGASKAFQYLTTAPSIMHWKSKMPCNSKSRWSIPWRLQCSILISSSSLETLCQLLVIMALSEMLWTAPALLHLEWLPYTFLYSNFCGTTPGPLSWLVIL